MTKQTESNLVKVLNVLAKEPNQACKEALEQPTNMVTIPLDKLEDMQRRLKEPTVAELNDEYLRDTHVEGMPPNYIAHNAMLTEMISRDHDTIMALKLELKMTQEQMAELRELLLKCQRKTS